MQTQATETLQENIEMSDGFKIFCRRWPSSDQANRVVIFLHGIEVHSIPVDCAVRRLRVILEPKLIFFATSMPTGSEANSSAIIMPAETPAEVNYPRIDSLACN